MRTANLDFRPKTDRTIPTLGYIYRPRIDPTEPVPMPTDPHRGPRMGLDTWPKNRGKR